MVQVIGSWFYSPSSTLNENLIGVNKHFTGYFTTLAESFSYEKTSYFIETKLLIVADLNALLESISGPGISLETFIMFQINSLSERLQGLDEMDFIE